LNRAKPGAPINGGLLAGGRGLPENLNEVQVADGKIKARQISGPIDELLAALEKVDDAPFGVESVQEAIVEQIQVGDRDKLVGQIDRLRKLAKDPRAGVRRTALWALGRSRDLTVASLLLKGLTDLDVGAM